MSWPYSPRTRIRPFGLSEPMKPPRASLAGGQSSMSGRWPSRVWMTVIPASRAAESTRWSGSTALHSSETSLPSAAPKPPGSRKSRCMSMTTSAVVSRSKANGPGCAGTSVVMRDLS